MLVATFVDVPRYRMLDTLRAYGLDRLAATNELDSATERLLRWAVRLVRWIEGAVITEDEPSAAACSRCRGRQPPVRAGTRRDPPTTWTWRRRW